MKNQILNRLKLASSYFYIRYCLLFLTAAFAVGILSCDEKKSDRGLAPSIESKPTENTYRAETKDTQQPTSFSGNARKVVYLNKATFKVTKTAGDTDLVPLNKGVDKLLKIYFSKDGSDLTTFLTNQKHFLNQDYVDAKALNDVLNDYEKVKMQNLKRESFVNFVDALTLASKNAVILNEPQQPAPNPISPSTSKVMTPKPVEEEPLFPPWALWTALLVVLSAFGYFVYDKLKKEAKAEQEKEYYKKQAARVQQQRQEAAQQEREEKLKKDMAEEKQKRLEAERELAELKANTNSATINTLENDANTNDLSLNVMLKDTDEAAPLVVAPMFEIAYLSLPMNELIFNNASKSSVAMVGQSFYEFSINTDGTSATFKFWNNADAVKHAIDKPHSHIEPACEPINARDSYATQIVTVEPGVAVLEDNKWMVKSKAKIKYVL